MRNEPHFEQKRKWWILGAMTTSVSMVFIDVTVLPVALPTISRELNFSELGLQWILNAYTLALTVLVLAGGKVAQLFGLKKIFCFGISLFALASAMCGLGNTESWLIISRIFQGAGGALMLPSTQAIIAHSFPSQQRGKAIGIFISIGSVFLTLGPLIGGYLTQFASWRYVFWINLPIAGAGLLLTLFTVPSFPKYKGSFDLIGFLANLASISAIVISIMQAQQWGWLSLPTLSLLSFGIALLAFMVRKERSEPSPLIDVELIKNRSVFPSLLVAGTAQFTLIITVFWAIYFQTILGYSPSGAGNITFLANIPFLIAAPLAGACVDRFGPKLPVCIGFSLIFLSLISFISIINTATLWQLLPSIICFGLGIPFIQTPSATSLMSASPVEKRATASGLLITSRQFSSTLSLAILGTLYSHLSNWRFSVLMLEQPVEGNLDPRQFEGLLSYNPSAVQSLQRLSPKTAAIVEATCKEAAITGFYAINIAAALVAFLGLLIALKWMKKKRKEA